jgi:hypothetical protein
MPSAAGIQTLGHDDMTAEVRLVRRLAHRRLRDVFDRDRDGLNLADFEKGLVKISQHQQQNHYRECGADFELPRGSLFPGHVTYPLSA